ncbi:MAG: type transport system permease protein [Solirubrobacterales bacterium]|jgi:ABC-2 type transport system permease protein|nr:type transport system permease protein [Solirubrobacterales bacterium]
MSEGAVAVANRPSLWVQAPELARRSIMRTIRQPAAIIPATVFPMILLAINSVGLKSATSLPGFPTNSYLTFALSFAFIQAGVFAVIGTGQNLAEDNQGGFFNRLQLTPLHPAALVAGQLAGTLTLGLFQAATYIAVGLLAGAHIQAGLGGAFVLIALAIVISLAFGSVGLAVGMRSNTPESVQSLFPLIFVFLFMSSMSMPRNLIQTDWFRIVATYNPVSYMIEGLRSLLITGWDGEALALGFACAFGVLAIGLTVASFSLKERMART